MIRSSSDIRLEVARRERQHRESQTTSTATPETADRTARTSLTMAGVRFYRSLTHPRHRGCEPVSAR